MNAYTVDPWLLTLDPYHADQQIFTIIQRLTLIIYADVQICNIIKNDKDRILNSEDIKVLNN